MEEEKTLTENARVQGQGLELHLMNAIAPHQTITVPAEAIVPMLVT